MAENKNYDRIVGSLMRIYRNSPFHSMRMGGFLARILAWLVRSRKSTRMIKEINAVKFELDLDQSIDSSLFFSGTFEEREEKVIKGILSPGMIALDIGANFGYHTFQMARLVAPGGWVYAIEPTTWAYDKLIRNADLNPDLKNLTFFRMGLSDVDAGIQVISFQSSYRLDGKQTGQVDEVSISTLDTVVKEKNITRLDFIKMDVDGYEAKVIRGAQNTLSTLKPILLMEISPGSIRQNGDSLDAMIHSLESLGYHFKTTQELPINDLNAFCMKLPKDTSTMVIADPLGR